MIKGKIRGRIQKIEKKFSMCGKSKSAYTYLYVKGRLFLKKTKSFQEDTFCVFLEFEDGRTDIVSRDILIDKDNEIIDYDVSGEINLDKVLAKLKKENVK